MSGAKVVRGGPSRNHRKYPAADAYYICGGLRANAARVRDAGRFKMHDLASTVRAKFGLDTHRAIDKFSHCWPERKRRMALKGTPVLRVFLAARVCRCSRERNAGKEIHELLIHSSCYED